MRKKLSLSKILILGVLLVAPLSLTYCGNAGQGESVASHYVGPVGPTEPSHYYFEAMVTPHTVKNDSTVLITVKIWDSNGNVAGGVTVNAVGVETSGTTMSDVNGQATFILTVTGNAGGLTHITVGVEDSALTIPVQIVPVSGAA